MNTLTHALLPVIFTGLFSRKTAAPSRRDLILTALAGALPDLLNPHFTLAARLASWSHGLPFWLCFTGALLLTAKFQPRWMSLRMAWMMAAAYLFHLWCDAISGGDNFGYPLRDFTWGDYWVDPTWWIPLDIGCVLACYLIFRAWPALRLSREKARFSADPAQGYAKGESPVE